MNLNVIGAHRENRRNRVDLHRIPTHTAGSMASQFGRLGDLAPGSLAGLLDHVSEQPLPRRAG